MNESLSSVNKLSRAGLYVDGFNMYHALAELREPHLKWLNLRRLGELIIPNATESLDRVVYCSAYFPAKADGQKKWRHMQYVAALKHFDVDFIDGHYVIEPMDCRNCGGGWDKPTEKEGDINVALHLFHDASRGRIDHAYLLTADSDQAATVKMVKKWCPHVRITTVSPPGRNFSVHIANLADNRIALNRDHVARSLLPPAIIHGGTTVARRPREYDPPAGWAPPVQIVA